MERIKGLSVKIDETIEHFLLFLGRYGQTVYSIARYPLSPQRLLNDYEQTTHSFVRPLTFLTIGAFCFSLLISVFPKGIEALPYILFEADSVKALLKERWKDAFSITTLFTTGMPTILTVVLISKLSGKLFYKDAVIRTKWFHLNCYAFGGQMILIFAIFFLDAAIESFVILVPSLEDIQLNDEAFAWLGGSLLLATIFVALFCPLLVLASGYFKLSMLGQLNSATIRGIILAICYYIFALYMYPAIASLLPSLEEKYFPAPEPEGRIVGYKSEIFSPEKDLYSFDFSLLIDNPLDKDFSMEIEPHEIEFQWGIDADEPEESWALHGSTVSLKEPFSLTNIAIIRKNTKEKLLIGLDGVELARIYCEAAVLSQAQDDSHVEGLLNSLSLRIEIDGIDETQLVDMDEFFSSDFIEIDEILVLCRSRSDLGTSE